ncbi:Mettl20 [Scenedesmus sp. PABB004]|nr:Mettl20 [Scenedesmus sp. PABB004]
MALSMMQKRAVAPARAGRAARVAVVARASSSPSKTATGLTVLAKIEELGLLSKVEELGLLSKLESSGLTLSQIEKSGLLSKAEKSGLLTLIADKSTPGLLSTLGLVAAVGAAGLVYAIPDDSQALVAAQVVGAATLGGAAIAAFVGSSILGSLQKPGRQRCCSAGSRRLEGTPLDAALAPSGLALMRQEFAVAGRVLALITPADVDAVLDYFIAEGVDGDPYWCRVWPSAIALASQLLARPALVAGKRVADLGAGLGVAGIAAALAGAAEVVLLDREPMALQCALMSAAASGVAGVQGLESVALRPLGAAGAAGGGGDAARAAPEGLLQLAELYAQQSRLLQQSQPAQQSAQQPRAQLAPQPLAPADARRGGGGGVLRGELFDWNAPPAGEGFDVVLACDVLYEDSAVAPVAAAVPRLLRRRGGGALLLADPPNRTAANRARFAALLAAPPGGGGARLVLEESAVTACDVEQLDPEMAGGVGSAESVPVQLMTFRAPVGNDTVGLKLDPLGA